MKVLPFFDGTVKGILQNRHWWVPNGPTRENYPKNPITLSTAISKHVLKQHPPLDMFCPLLLKKVVFDRSLSAQHQPSPRALTNMKRINKAYISLPNYTCLSIGETQLSLKKKSNKFQIISQLIKKLHPL